MNDQTAQVPQSVTATQDPNSSNSQTTPPVGLVEKSKAFLQTQSAATPAPIQSSVTGSNTVRGLTSLLDALAKKGLITDEDMRAVKFESVTYNKPVEELLKAKGNVAEDDIQRVKAEMRGIKFVDLSVLSIAPGVLSKIAKDVANKVWAISFEETPNSIKVGMVDPLDLQSIQFIESIIGKKVDAYYASKSDIEQIVNTKYGAEIGTAVGEAMADVNKDIYDLKKMETTDVQSSKSDAPVIKIVNMVLDYAAKHGASDVHIEPHESKIGVRYRINGILSEKLTIPMELAAPVVTRIKIMSNMKIDEHRVPQDGRFQIKVSDNQMVDLRVSVIPTVYGEKVVMRLLEKGGGLMDLTTTGLRGPAFDIFNQQLTKTQGLILVTGPTGSGKTQTLASCLKVLNKPEVNIMTLEDPVEIRIDGVNQVQVNREVGLTFANGLRSFLRQNPDIILVGEIRDEETAKLAVEASLTGHLVLATLHTNSAAGAPPRLIEMGVEPYLLASTVNVVVAQRLVRKIVKEGVQPYAASKEIVQKMHEILDPLNGFKLRTEDGKVISFDKNTTNVTLYKPSATSQNDTGYGGRMGIFEVFPVSEKISEMVIRGASANEIQKQAKLEGMISMSQDGFIKALEGLTTIEEVLRVVS